MSLPTPSPKIGNKSKMFLLQLLYNIMLEFLANAIRQGKEIRCI